MISNTNFYLLLFHSLTAFRLQILHLLSMMPRNVVDDYFFKELLHMLELFTSPTHDGQHHPSVGFIDVAKLCPRHWSSHSTMTS